MSSYAFDVAAIEEALDFLEIDLPVQVKFSAGIRRAGCHRVRDERHVITISTYLSLDESRQALWHELVHASQTERYETPAEFHAEYRASSRIVGYNANRFEREAREVAEAYADEFPLTKVAR